jgi:hypothetical protein
MKLLIKILYLYLSIAKEVLDLLMGNADGAKALIDAIWPIETVYNYQHLYSNAYGCSVFYYSTAVLFLALMCEIRFGL